MGDTSLHVINPAEGQSFESISISKPADVSADNGYKIEFDIYYPTTNSYDLNVRFYKSSSAHNDVVVSSSDNIQHITITNEDYYRLELFTRDNLEETKYWISNIICSPL